MKILFLISLAFACLAGEEASPTGAHADGLSRPAFEKLIQQLGHADFSLREKAAADLRKLGRRAEKELRSAVAAETDAEIVSRCRTLLADCELDGLRGAIIETSLGSIEIELFPDKAPQTVRNFATYVKDGFYSDTTFHRVISGFMIQGGGFTNDMTEKKTRAPIPNEAANGLKNAAGTIAMARMHGDARSATAQFFINLIDNVTLDHRGTTDHDWGYCVFGRVVKGMETIEAIKAVPAGEHGIHRDVPRDPVVIKSIKLK